VLSASGQRFGSDQFLYHRQASLTEQANARAAAGSSGAAAGNGILATMFGRSAAPAESSAAAAEPDAEEAPKVALQSYKFCISFSHVHPLNIHPGFSRGFVAPSCNVRQAMKCVVHLVHVWLMPWYSSVCTCEACFPACCACTH
jgi:hypothetical protein